MALKRRKKLPPGGPFLATAVLCEKVLHERDNVVSLIRLIDRITVTAGADAPEDLPPVPVNLVAFISFKAGMLRGKFSVTVRTHPPSGTALPETTIPALFEGEERGVNLQVGVAGTFNEEGLYWIEILVEGQTMTRIPLRIVYQRVAQSGGASANPST